MVAYVCYLYLFSLATRQIWPALTENLFVAGLTQNTHRERGRETETHTHTQRNPCRRESDFENVQHCCCWPRFYYFCLQLLLVWQLQLYLLQSPLSSSCMPTNGPSDRKLLLTFCTLCTVTFAVIVASLARCNSCWTRALMQFVIFNFGSLGSVRNGMAFSGIWCHKSGPYLNYSKNILLAP